VGNYQSKTEDGHLLSEVVSALQKCIRRGEEYQALYFAAEMYRSGYVKYLWKRLMVTAAEDIGLAAPEVVSQVFQLCQISEWFRKNYGKEDDHDALHVSQAIIALCRAPKCRMNDHAACLFFYNEYKVPRVPIPDYALDEHTARGRSMGRGGEHFIAEGAKLENSSDIPNPYEEMFLKRAREGKYKVRKPNSNSNGQAVQGQIFDMNLKDFL
jgi:replication-associated recombination protein RarA